MSYFYLSVITTTRKPKTSPKFFYIFSKGRAKLSKNDSLKKNFSRKRENYFGIPHWVLCNLPFLFSGRSQSASLSVFKYCDEGPLFFLIFCMKLGYNKGTKVTEPNFGKKSWGSQMGENPHFRGILDVFCPCLYIQSLKFSEITYRKIPNISPFEYKPPPPNISPPTY